MEIYAVSVRQAGRMLSLGRTKIYELINQGRLDIRKIGRRTLVTTASIRRLIDGEG